MKSALLDQIYEILSEKYVLIQKRSKTTSLEEIIRNIIDSYEEIIDSMPGNVYWLDNNLMTVGCNRNVLNMFGFKSLSEFKGLSFSEMGKAGNWTPEAKISFENDTREVIRTGKAKLNIEEPPIPHKDGKIIYFLTSRVPIFDRQKNVIGVVGISVDITDRKKAEEDLRRAKEEAEAANKAKTEFLEIMTHELRTPLNGIIGSVQMLLRHPNKKIIECHDKFQDILFSGETLKRHINDILDYAELRVGKLDLKPNMFNLRESIRQSVENISLSPPATQKNVKFPINISEELPEYLFGDSVRLGQIIYNFAGNALKFSPDHTIVTTTIDCLEKNEKQILIKISVTDKGPGIPKNKQALIFEKFTQLDRDKNTSIKGTGLGLSIVQELVKKFGGEVGVDSKVGKGSTFWVTLPLLLQDNRPKKDRVLQPPRRSTSNNRLVLVVEDDLISRTVLSALLADLKCEVKTAQNSKEVFKLLAQYSFDLVFMDINLDHNEKGYVIANEMRKKSFENPIIALTANSASHTHQNYCEHGIDDVLGKPFRVEELAEALERWLPG